MVLARKIEAIVRSGKLEAVKDALDRFGIHLNHQRLLRYHYLRRLAEPGCRVTPEPEPVTAA